MELVCPAGSLPALKTAVDNGADAVYFGFRDSTNARQFAGLNFNEKRAGEGIEYAHSKGSRVFCAINTYPQPDGWEQWKGAVDRAANLGVDAIILADMGLLDYAAESLFPDPDLHPCLRNRLTTDGVEDETLERSRSIANPNHQGQVAFPDPGKLHDVVRFLEIRVRAGDQEIEARLDILRHGDELHLLVVIDRGRQVR